MKGGKKEVMKSYSFIFMILVFLVSTSFISALSLTVNNPLDGYKYNTRDIQLDLESDEVSDFYVTKNVYTETGWRRLCSNSLTCDQSFRFSEGENSILIKAVNNEDQTDLEQVSFLIDTKSPRISRTSPRRNSVVKGDEFTVKYTEMATETVTLYYGGDLQGISSVQKSDCPSGRNVECEFGSVDLSAYDGDMIEYWFEIEDEAGNIEQSRRIVVEADTTAPVSHFFDYEVQGRGVEFVFEIEDKNFDQITYIDGRDIRPSEKRLCSRLKNGRCSLRKSFRRGSHQLDIYVYDEAGNSFQIADDLQFTI